MKFHPLKHLPLVAAFSLGPTLLCSHATQPNEVKSEGASAVTVGREIRMKCFAFGGVGIGGSTSEEEKFFARVYSLGGTKELLDLYRTGDLQAKAYALVGLRWRSPEDYQKLRADFIANENLVNTMQGCIVSGQKTPEIIASIEAGTYDPYRPAPDAKKPANPIP